MKALNNIKFVVEATATFNKWLDAIDSAGSYEEAKNRQTQGSDLSTV